MTLTLLVQSLLLIPGSAVAGREMASPEAPVGEPDANPQKEAGSNEKWPRPVPQQVATLKYEEAKKLIDERKWAEAAIVLRAFLRERADFMPAYLNLARALAYLNRREEALVLLEQAADSAPPADREALVRRSRVLSRQFLENETFQIHQEGVTLLFRRKYKDATGRFLRALDREADNTEILLRLGQALLLSGDHDSASERLRAARRLNPHEPEIQLWLGRALYLRGELQKALGELSEAWRRLPKSEMAPVWLADAYLASGRRREASDILEKDLKREPLHISSLIALARIRTESIGPLDLSARDNPLWIARKDLQLALSRFEDYSDMASRGAFHTDLSFSPFNPKEIKAQAQTLLAQLEGRIDGTRSGGSGERVDDDR